MFKKMVTNYFLFEELVKRDFKQKYKGTILGMAWSILSPLANLAIMKLIFTYLFGKNISHYTIYLFCGTLVWSYFKESTKGGMNSLTSNKSIITKINIPKYLFLLSKNVSVLINFCLTLVIFFIFCYFDGIKFGLHMFCLMVPIVLLVIFNIGVGLILSAMQVFFRDTSYFYDIFLTLLHYLCAIFYQIERFPVKYQRWFLANPIYCFIKYFRVIVLDGNIPSLQFNVLCIFYALIALLVGLLIYKKNNHKFLYYM